MKILPPEQVALNAHGELINSLNSLGLEQISDIMISPAKKDDQKIKIDGELFVNNVRYHVKERFFVKQKTKTEYFYIRSIGKDANLLLYSHYKQLVDENLSGVFSIGSGLDGEYNEADFLICQLLHKNKTAELLKILKDAHIDVISYYDIHQFGTTHVIVFSKLEYKENETE